MNRNSLLVLFFCFAQYLFAGEASFQELTLDEMLTRIAQIANDEWGDYFPDEETRKTVFSKAKYIAFSNASSSLYNIFTGNLKKLASLDPSSHRQKARMLSNIEDCVRKEVSLRIKEELKAMRLVCSNRNKTLPFQLADESSVLEFIGKIQRLFDDALSHFSKDIHIEMKMGSQMPLPNLEDESFRLAIKSALFLALNNNLTSLSQS